MTNHGSHIISAIQMNSGMDLQANLDMAENLIVQAASKGAKIAVLPENFPLLGRGEAYSHAKQGIQEAYGNGKIQSFLRDLAIKLKVWIVGGTIPLISSIPGKTYAATLVYNDQGDVVARYDKLHLFDVKLSDHEAYCESEFIVPGNKIVVIDTPCGRVGLAICYDIRFPELFRQMFVQGAQIFIIPSAFTLPTGKAHWDILTKAIAVQNFSYVVAADQTGTHGMGRETYGHSLIINPTGAVIASIESDVGVISAEMDMDVLKRQRSAIPIAEHQRIMMDCGSITQR